MSFKSSQCGAVALLRLKKSLPKISVLLVLGGSGAVLIRGVANPAVLSKELLPVVCLRYSVLRPNFSQPSS